jgi:hypothetical protein
MTSTRCPLYTGVRYRAFPTGRDYTFTFAYVTEAHSWRAYVQDCPAYGDRLSDAQSTHRLRDEHGAYVCWDSEISSLSECQGVAALWADCTENYLGTGRFSPPEGRPTIQDRSILAAVSRLAGPSSPPPSSTPANARPRLLRRW